MKKYKKILLIFVLFIGAFFTASQVKAVIVDRADDCAKKGTCKFICSYTESGTNNNFTLYYHQDEYGLGNSWSMAIQYLDTKDTNDSPQPLSEVIDYEGGEKNFVCPNQIYYTQDLDGNFQFCSGNNCTYTNAAELNFNLFSDIDNFYSGITFIDDDGASCSDLESGDFDADSYLKTKIAKGITNFFPGFRTPTFLPSYLMQIDNSEKYKDSIQDALAAKKRYCESELTNDLNNGTITRKEKGQKSANINNVKIKDFTKLSEGAYNFEKGLAWDSMSCRILLGDPENPEQLAYWIQFILNIIKYVAIIALLVLSTTEFIKALVANDKEAIKNAAVKTAKRFVFAVLIFFLPIIIEVLMKLVGAYGTCGIG